MKREDWERIGSFFEEALKREGAERDEFLSKLGDPEVEEELRSLLSAHERRGAFDNLADYVNGPKAQRLLRLAPGDRIGPYRIVRELGSGGMATVYEAEDLKHERQVAIKVLRPELAAVLGAERFLHEISTTARLQHPHILPLLDSGQAEGFLYYVMPCIEGETLRDRLNRERQLGIEEAVRIASEVADALDYAHRHDVIHRDIKPENILLHDGRPLVADFGIALAVSAAAGGRITETGLSLGTPQYMSPEQATAEKDIAHRSDIYSLGCVLYEMLTGEPPHTGTSAQQIMRKVVTDEVRPITDLRRSVPPNVAAAAAKSLEKLPADRFDSARSFADALADPAFTTPATGVEGVARARDRWKQLAVGLIAVAVVATLASVWGWLRSMPREGDRPVVEFYLDPPDPTTSFGIGLVLSPDGRRLVCQVKTDQESVLYQRTLDARDWQIIPGTEGAYAPFFSPDGEWLGFISDQENSIKKIRLTGGSAHTIARVEAGVEGASWGPDNTIIFSSQQSASGDKKLWLYRVTAGGGVPERLTTTDPALRELGPRDPHYLPSGDVVLFTNVNTQLEPSVTALSLVSGRVSGLAHGMNPLSDRAGRVLYVTPEGKVVAQTFNSRTLALGGSPKPIAEGIAITVGLVASYSVSPDGSLAYLSEPNQGDRLMLADRSGEARPLFSAGIGSSLGGPRFSPSGDRIAFIRDKDVWVYSLAQGTAQRLSFEGPAADPAWTTDGRFIAYSTIEGDESFASLYLRAADGTSSAKLLLAGNRDVYQVDFAPGDSEVVFYSASKVFRASLNGDSGLVSLIETESFVEHPTLSPDGRWLAYKSNESGCNEVYVRSYPDMGPPTVVSNGCGGAPAWSADGSQIFYWDPNRIIAVSLRYDGSRVTVVGRAELFSTDPFRWFYNRNYDVHPNGQQFVMVARPKTRVVWRVNALAGGR